MWELRCFSSEGSATACFYPKSPNEGNRGHPSITYYNMGDVTKDDLNNTYSYDAEGRPITINNVTTVFDAFGRAVEQNRSGVYTQIVYSPTGQKFMHRKINTSLQGQHSGVRSV